MSPRMKPPLTTAKAQRLREAVLRRQNGNADVIHLDPPLPTEEVPIEVLRLREKRPDYKQPEYPNIKVDPTTCLKEIAYIRDMVAKHRNGKFPVGPVRHTQNLRKAAFWLRAENREPLPQRVTVFVDEKRGGDWNHGSHQNSLAFNQSGLMCDGLKRVIAGIETDEAEYDDWIWFGVPDAAFDSMDTNAPRTAPQNLKVKGIQNHSLLSQVAKLRHRIDTKDSPVSQRAIYRSAEKLSGIVVMHDAIKAGNSLRKTTGVTASSATLAYWLIASDEPRLELELQSFWEHLKAGTHAKDGSPVLACRNKLMLAAGKKRRKDTAQVIRGKVSHQYLNQVEQVAWIIMAWNLWINDLPVPSTSWPIWGGLAPLDAKGRWEKEVDDDGNVVTVRARDHHGVMQDMPKDKPRLSPMYSLPPVGAGDAWGRGDPVSVQRNREKQSTFRKRRQRTPGNVFRAQF